MPFAFASSMTLAMGASARFTISSEMLRVRTHGRREMSDDCGSERTARDGSAVLLALPPHLLNWSRVTVVMKSCPSNSSSMLSWKSLDALSASLILRASRVSLAMARSEVRIEAPLRARAPFMSCGERARRAGRERASG
jgi:hypothetical protein